MLTKYGMVLVRVHTFMTTVPFNILCVVGQEQGGRSKLRASWMSEDPCRDMWLLPFAQRDLCSRLGNYEA